jgi:hypothetical protein
MVGRSVNSELEKLWYYPGVCWKEGFVKLKLGMSILELLCMNVELVSP